MKDNITDDIKKRFWAKVDKRGPDECWEWVGANTGGKSRYGILRVNNRGFLAHRLSYSLKHGNIPDGLCVLHRCDNPSCVNPGHLFLGTYLENNRDKARKGRANPPYGTREPNHKLTAADVIRIRKRYAAGDTRQRDIAAQYGVSQRLISLIVRREAWRHIK